MSNKSKTTPATKFYSEPVKAEELHTGFLQKSPPTWPLTKGILQQKSWKRRFFVLSKMGDDKYQLAYYANKEKRDKPLGEIDISNISSLSTHPESHQMWDWIQRHFKCAPSSVLFLRVASRDYFLIGETSDDVDDWCSAITTVLQKLPQQPQNTDDTTQANRIRSISAPLDSMFEDKPDEDPLDDRWSAPGRMVNSLQPGHYDYPRKLSGPAVLAYKFTVKEDKDENDWKKEDEDETEPGQYDYPRKLSAAAVLAHKVIVKDDMDENDGEKEEEDKTEDSQYMCMSSVHTVLENEQKEDDTASTQTNTSINGHELPVCNGEVNHNDDENKRMSTDETNSKPLVNGNRASTELNGSLNESETCTHVEKDICISQNSLRNSLVLTQEEGKPCVSECREIQDSCLLHKGDQILAFNDLIIDTVEEIQTYLRRLSKDEVKLTIRRPLHLEPCPSH